MYGADSYGQLEMMPAYRVKKNPNGINCSSINPSEKHFVGNLPEPERTKYGFHVLPDTTDGAGPLYFSLIKKPSL